MWSINKRQTSAKGEYLKVLLGGIILGATSLLLGECIFLDSLLTQYCLTTPLWHKKEETENGKFELIH